jgi:hypothetical protein
MKFISGLVFFFLMHAVTASAQTPALSSYNQWFNGAIVETIKAIDKNEITPRLTDQEKKRIGPINYKIIKIGDENQDNCVGTTGSAYSRKLFGGGHEIVICATAARYLMDSIEAYVLADLMLLKGRINVDQLQQILAYYLIKGRTASDALIIGQPPGPSCTPMSIVYLYSTSQQNSGCDTGLADKTAAKSIVWWLNESGLKTLMGKDEPPLTEKTISAEIDRFSRISALAGLTYVLAHEMAHIMNGDLDSSITKNGAISPAQLEQRADQLAMVLVSRKRGVMSSNFIILGAVPTLFHTSLVGIASEMTMNISEKAIANRLKTSFQYITKVMNAFMQSNEGREMLKENPELGQAMRRLGKLQS